MDRNKFMRFGVAAILFAAMTVIFAAVVDALSDAASAIASATIFGF